MNYWYILFPFAVWAISQTIKFCVRLKQHQVPRKLKGALWTYVWAGGMPSSHTAVLTSSLFLVWNQYGTSPILTFCIVITILWLYDMASQRKRQELMNGYFSHDNSKTLKKVVHDGYALDLAGHTVPEIAWGAVLGISLGIIAAYLILPK